MKTSRRRLDVDVEELDRLIDAAARAAEQADRQKLKTTLHALAERLAPKRSTEKTNSVLAPDPSPAASRSRRVGSGWSWAPCSHCVYRRKNCFHRAPHLQPGDPCPECREGKVYRQKEPKTLIRFVGQAPLKATVFEMERLRCNACGQVFTADEPASAGPEKYDMTAVAMIALLKYGTGMPFNRMERLEEQLGMPLPAATQWELMEAAAKPIRTRAGGVYPAGGAGQRDAQRRHGMRILNLVRSQATSGRGLSPAASYRLAGDGDRAVLYRMEACGRESRRCSEAARGELDAPIQMCDALSRNTPKLAGRNSDCQLSRPWKTAGGVSDLQLSLRMPLYTKDTTLRLSSLHTLSCKFCWPTVWRMEDGSL